MGEACIRLRDRSPAEEAREMGHRSFDRWFDGLVPLLDESENMTLGELSEQVQRTRGKLLGEVLQAAVERKYAEELERVQAACPLCASVVGRKRFESKAISTLQGSFVLRRPYFYCARCAHGFCPLDERLELAPGRHQHDIQVRGTRLAAQIPYETADTEFESLTGVKVSEHYLHGTVQEVGESATLEQVIPSCDEIVQRIEQARAGRPQRPVLVVSADGAFAPIRDKAPRDQKRGKGRWREVKGVRLYLIAPDKRIVPVASWHQIVAEGEEFAHDVVKIAARVPRDKVRVALVGDGADWVWGVLRPAFPGAEEVLDHYHCVEHLRDAARVQFADELDARQWVEATLVQLHHGEVDEAVDDLLEMEPRTKDAEGMIRKLIGYLVKHSHRVDYGRAKRRGMPRGSGGMESANKFISHTRLKRSGAWWLEENSNAMLRIRCALYNGTFDSVFRTHVERQQAARHRLKPVSS